MTLDKLMMEEKQKLEDNIANIEKKADEMATTINRVLNFRHSKEIYN